MSENFKDMLDGLPDDKWEQWGIEKKQGGEKIGELLQKIQKRAQESVLFREKLNRGINAVIRVEDVITQAEKALAWDIKDTTKLLRLEQMVKESETDSKKYGCVIRIDRGRLTTPGIVEKVQKVVDSQAQIGIVDEPIQIDPVLTIFQNKLQIEEVMESSTRNTGVSYITKGGRFLIIYSKAPKGVNRLNDVLSIAILPDRGSIRQCIKSLHKLRSGFRFGYEAEASMRYLELISKNYN